MSRSVNYQSGAELIKYTHVDAVYGKFNPDTEEYEGDEYNEFETQQLFEDTCENLKYALKEAFPSFDFIPERRKVRFRSEERAWNNANPECWPILQNGNCVVYLAEYCGLISISFCPAEDCSEYCEGKYGIQVHWIKAAEGKINAAIEGVTERLICCGRFSNGEAIYSPVSRKAELTALVNGEAI